jgi:tetratricopeptide (TPR) repeat protein
MASMVRKLLIGSVLLALLGVGSWFGWRWYTAPTPPAIALDGLDRDLVAAVEKAREEVRRQPRSGKAWGELSRVLIANDLNEDALPCLVQAERFDPGQPAWPYLHGSVLQLLSRPQEAIPWLRQALELAQVPEERLAIEFVLAQTLLGSGQPDEAEQHIRSLRQQEGDSPRVHLLLGLLAEARGDDSGAREHLIHLIDHPCARKQVCTILSKLARGDEKKAQRLAREAAEHPQDRPWPNSFDADVREYRIKPTDPLDKYFQWVAEGRHEEALNYLRDLVARSPDEPRCFALGFALVRRGEFDEAEKQLRRTLEFNPRNLKARLFRGAALLEKGEQLARSPEGKEKARELFRQALLAEDEVLGEKKDVAVAQLVRGRALKHLDRTKDALEALRQAVLIGPDLPEAHQALGEALAEDGQLKEGLEHLANAVRVAPPGDPRPRQALEKWRARVKSTP